eukprot:s555_g7.t1
MLTVNWGYHVYMKVFVPQVQAYSFVDNLTLAAREAAIVIQGYFAMLSFMSMFGLTMDDEKTFVWGLHKLMRQCLQQLGFPCLFAASELGASMTYGHQIRNSIMKNRGLGLEDKWARLKRSYAPGPQKISMLPKVFWPKALYGSPSCAFSDAHLTTLRRAAVKALRLNGAGSNPLLRLSLSNDMTCDPGFYQLRHCIATLRRLANKAPDLLHLWQAWHRKYEGKALPGPFTKLMGCLSQIGWRICEPPWIADHEQHTWNLLLVDEKTLTLLPHEAWCQLLAASVNHKTMSDLVGMDHYLTTLDNMKLTALECSLLSSLQSGAFISASEHAKYDVEKIHICSLCQCEDDRQHWLICPRFRNLRMAIEGWCPDNVELPTCTTHHLLIPRLPVQSEWRCALLQITDRTDSFFFVPPANRLLHLFVDGSCTVPEHWPLRIASWGVLCATTKEILALGHLHGLTQTIDRAELAAVLAATRCSQSNDLCIWSDSQSTVDTADFIQRNGFVPASVENYDMWLQFHDALGLRNGLQTHFRWTPSHIQVHLASDPFEHWLFWWNNAIDAIVSRWNWHRPQDFLQLQGRLERTLNWWTVRIRQLRHFYFRVAQHKDHLSDGLCDQSSAVDVIEISDEEANQDEYDLIADHLPLNWAVRSRQSDGKVPGSFIENLLQWLCAAEQLESHPVVVSDIELVFLLVQDTSFMFPFRLDGSSNWTLRALSDLFQVPTLAMLLRPVQFAMQQIHLLFPEALHRCPPAHLSSLGPAEHKSEMEAKFFEMRGHGAPENYRDVLYFQERFYPIWEDRPGLMSCGQFRSLLFAGTVDKSSRRIEIHPFIDVPEDLLEPPFCRRLDGFRRGITARLSPKCRLFLGTPVCGACLAGARIVAILQSGALPAVEERRVTGLLRGVAGELSDLVEANQTTGGKPPGGQPPHTGETPGHTPGPIKEEPEETKKAEAKKAEAEESYSEGPEKRKKAQTRRRTQRKRLQRTARRRGLLQKEQKRRSQLLRRQSHQRSTRRSPGDSSIPTSAQTT